MPSASLPGHVETSISETSSLLESPQAVVDYHAISDYESQKPLAQAIHQQTPLPRTQLASLCFVRFAEPINFTQIFPYVNEQIRSLHICDPASVGVYSGIIESSFAIAQVASVMEWGKLSDKVGRRPVIFAGTLGVMICTLMFGLSRSFWMLVLFRGLAGIFCGNVAVLQSVLGEITDSTNQASAMPLFAATWPVGSILGPLIGGTFSNPAEKFTFFDVEFLRQYPYFLPCFMAACVSLIGFALGYYFLEETLPSKIPQREKLSRSMSEDTLVDFEEIGGEGVHGPPPSQASIRALLEIPIIRALSISGCALSFISAAFDVVFVLFAYSPISSGGLNLPDSQIGYILALAGGFGFIIQLLLMPTLLRHFEAGKIYTTCICVFALAFMMMPLLNFYAHTSLATATDTKALLWIGIALTMLFSRMGNVAFTLSMILAKQHTPTPSCLGSVNGVIQWSMCFARAFSPAIVSSLFALCQKYTLLGGYLWSFLLAFLSLYSGLAFSGTL